MYSFFSSRASTQALSEERASKSPGTLSSFHPTRETKETSVEDSRKNQSLPASAGAETARSHASSIVQHMGLAISAALSGKESGYPPKEAWETLVL